LIAKNLLTGSLKNRSIDNLEMQKKSISMKNSQFFDYLLYAKSVDRFLFTNMKTRRLQHSTTAHE
jgi:hypothetical protein